ncbi:MAG: AMP-binding protein, partial [Bacteroidota bacterium]
RWYVGGQTNACHNALDRHVDAGNGGKTALIFEPDDPSAQEARHISYAEALDETKTMANVLKNHGVTKGDRVTIYMPMIPEAAYAMLACARIGAI